MDARTDEIDGGSVEGLGGSPGGEPGGAAQRGTHPDDDAAPHHPTPTADALRDQPGHARPAAAVPSVVRGTDADRTAAVPPVGMRPPAQDPAEADRVVLRGSRLRSALVVVLLRHGEPADIPTLERLLWAAGIRTAGRPSKCISDALRTEVARGRVVQLDRGVYAPGRVTRQDRHRLRRRVAEAVRRTKAGEPVPR